jgi:Caspase domain
MAFLALALAAAGVSNGVETAGNGVFLLEVPELKIKVSESATATLPHSFVNRLQLRVLRSSQDIPPGKILVRVNGEAANIIMTTQAAESTIVCDLDLYFRPGFLLHPGRNSVEASAESIYGRAYYGAFLLDVGEEPESLREVQRETTVNQPGDKPPLIDLIHPQGPVENQRQLTVQGYIEGGVAPVSLTIQNQPIPLTMGAPPSGARGVHLGAEEAGYSFSTQLSIGTKQDSVEVTATDAHNNRTRLLIPVVQGTQSTGRRYAVVIGVSIYRDPRIRSLKFADKDAEAVRDFLLDPNGGAVPPANLLFLENQDASYARIRNALFDFLIRPGPDDLAIVYFAGHGANDPKRPDNYYLLGYDTDRENLASTGVPMWDLQEVFERTLRANVVTLVDACHSAAIGQTTLNLVNQRWTAAAHGSLHRAIITASNIAEYSNEDPRWGGGHGVFTWFLLQGLEGAADANHDHQISVGELFDFVHHHVVEETGGSQTPTALAGLARGLVLKPNVSGTASARLALAQSASQGGAQ